MTSHDPPSADEIRALPFPVGASGFFYDPDSACWVFMDPWGDLESVPSVQAACLAAIHWFRERAEACDEDGYFAEWRNRDLATAHMRGHEARHWLACADQWAAVLRRVQ
jgi:hypothetical protein